MCGRAVGDALDVSGVLTCIRVCRSSRAHPLVPLPISTPLSKAILQDDVILLDSLLETSPSFVSVPIRVLMPNPPAPPVMFAAWADRPLVVERLVRRHKADVDACDAEGSAPQARRGATD